MISNRFLNNCPLYCRPALKWDADVACRQSHRNMWPEPGSSFTKRELSGKLQCFFIYSEVMRATFLQWTAYVCQAATHLPLRAQLPSSTWTLGAVPTLTDPTDLGNLQAFSELAIWVLGYTWQNLLEMDPIPPSCTQTSSGPANAYWINEWMKKINGGVNEWMCVQKKIHKW